MLKKIWTAVWSMALIAIGVGMLWGLYSWVNNKFSGNDSGNTAGASGSSGITMLEKIQMQVIGPDNSASEYERELKIRQTTDMVRDRLVRSYCLDKTEVDELLKKHDNMPSDAFRRDLLNTYGIVSPKHWSNLPTNRMAIPQGTRYHFEMKITKEPSRIFPYAGFRVDINPKDPTDTADLVFILDPDKETRASARCILFREGVYYHLIGNTQTVIRPEDIIAAFKCRTIAYKLPEDCVQDEVVKILNFERILEWLVPQLVE